IRRGAGSPASVAPHLRKLVAEDVARSKGRNEVVELSLVVGTTVHGLHSVQGATKMRAIGAQSCQTTRETWVYLSLLLGATLLVLLPPLEVLIVVAGFAERREEGVEDAKELIRRHLHRIFAKSSHSLFVLHQEIKLHVLEAVFQLGKLVCSSRDELLHDEDKLVSMLRRL
ncbi:unnamed protein product, partial [Ixodes persulcatus]